MSGGTEDDNFHFQWGSISGTYTVTDTGGTDQISFDSLDDAQIAFTAASSTSGQIVAYPGYSVALDVTPTIVNYSNIDKILVSDLSVPSFATNDYAKVQNITSEIVQLQSLSASGDKGYVIAATSAANAITINQACVALIAFGKGGGDTFSFSNTGTKSVMAIGGSTATDNVDDGSNGGTANDGIPDDYINVFSYSGMSTGIYAQLGYYGANSALVEDAATRSTTSIFNHQLYDVGSFVGSFANDTIIVSSSTFSSIDGGNGADTITGGSGVDKIIGGAGSDILSGGTGADIFKYQDTTDCGDQIQDFVSGQDKMSFNYQFFNGSTTGGALIVGNFISGAGVTTASTTGQYYIFDTTSHILYYDADGSNNVSNPLAIADFSANGANLTNADISIY